MVVYPVNGKFSNIESWYNWCVNGGPISEVRETPFTQVTNRLTTSGNTQALNRRGWTKKLAYLVSDGSRVKGNVLVWVNVRTANAAT